MTYAQFSFSVAKSRLSFGFVTVDDARLWELKFFFFRRIAPVTMDACQVNEGESDSMSSAGVRMHLQDDGDPDVELGLAPLLPQVLDEDVNTGSFSISGEDDGTPVDMKQRTSSSSFSGYEDEFEEVLRKGHRTVERCAAKANKNKVRKQNMRSRLRRLSVINGGIWISGVNKIEINLPSTSAGGGPPSGMEGVIVKFVGAESLVVEGNAVATTTLDFNVGCDVSNGNFFVSNTCSKKVNGHKQREVSIGGEISTGKRVGDDVVDDDVHWDEFWSGDEEEFGIVAGGGMKVLGLSTNCDVVSDDVGTAESSSDRR